MRSEIKEWKKEQAQAAPAHGLGRPVFPAFHAPSCHPTTSLRPASGFIAGLVLVSAGLAGCQRSQPPVAAPTPVEVRTKDGPVEMIVRAAKGQILVAEKLVLTVEVVAPDDVQVELPRFEDQIGEFRIRRRRDEPAIPTERGRQWRQEYELDQFLAGDYEIPPLPVTYTDRRAAKPTATAGTPATQPSAPVSQDPALLDHLLSSPPIRIRVVSAIEGPFDPDQFEDIRGTVELPPPDGRRWLYGIVILAVAALVLAGAWLFLRRRSAVDHLPPPAPAHLWAKEELRRLREDRLVEQGLVHDLYFRLTGIVRRYIEKRFGIMAAEQTTDEFLATARSHPRLLGEHRDSLARFLQAGDLVKFARYTPELTEIDEAFEAAETFVDRTAAPLTPPAPPASGAGPASGSKPKVQP